MIEQADHFNKREKNLLFAFQSEHGLHSISYNQDIQDLLTDNNIAHALIKP